MNEKKHISAYDNMVKHLHDALDDDSKSLGDGIDVAKEKTHAHENLTADEINKVSGYVRRDIEDVAHSLTDKGNDSLSEWLKFDIEMIENFALDAFLSVADKTRIEIAKIEQQARQATIYKTGEITSPGTLVCSQCSKEINFISTSAIPACPECGNKTFQRC